MVRVTLINVLLYKNVNLNYEKFELIPMCVNVGTPCSS